MPNEGVFRIEPPEIRKKVVEREVRLKISRFDQRGRVPDVPRRIYRDRLGGRLETVSFV